MENKTKRTRMTNKNQKRFKKKQITNIKRGNHEIKDTK